MYSSQALNRLRFVAIVFVAFCWTANLAVVRLNESADSLHLHALLVGLVFAEIGLLVTWVAHEPSQLATKTLLVVFAAAILAQPLVAFLGRADADWWGMFVAYACAVFLATWLLRPQWGKRWNGQMSLQGIFSLTTAVAILAGVQPMIRFPGWENVAFGLAVAVSFAGVVAGFEAQRFRGSGLPRQTGPLIGCLMQFAAVIVGSKLGLSASVFATTLVAQGSLVTLAFVLKRISLQGRQDSSAAPDRVFGVGQDLQVVVVREPLT